MQCANSVLRQIDVGRKRQGDKAILAFGGLYIGLQCRVFLETVSRRPFDLRLVIFSRYVVHVFTYWPSSHLYPFLLFDPNTLEPTTKLFFCLQISTHSPLATNNYQTIFLLANFKAFLLFFMFCLLYYNSSGNTSNFEIIIHENLF